MKTIFYLFFVIAICSCKTKKSNGDIINNSIQQPKAENGKAEESREDKIAKTIAYNDSLNKALEWKQVEDDLYINKKGELGIWAFRLLDAPDDGYVYYQTSLCNESKPPLNAIIDPATYKRLVGGGFGAYYKDSKHIYHTFGTSGGTNFTVESEADYSTFKIINDCYAKDKNHVYHIRFGVIDNADPSTFKIMEYEARCYAKDKNAYYRDEEILEGEMLSDPEIQRAIKQLDEL